MTAALRYALVVGGGLVSILLFLLATASDNSGFFDRYYSQLLVLNAVAAAVLLVVVIVALARLYGRYKSGKFGSRLMARLIVLFGGIGILPGLIIFLVSVQFVSHSIDSWFDVKIEEALKSGLNLGIAALDEALVELDASAREAAPTLAGQQSEGLHASLAALIEDDASMQNVMVVAADGKLIASASAKPGADLTPDLPTPKMLTQAHALAGYKMLEGGGEREFTEASIDAASKSAESAGSLRLRVLVAIPGQDLDQQRYLQLLQSVPSNLAANAEVLRIAYSEYKERDVARAGLRKMYIGTLTLTLLLAIFGAIASAFVIANNLAQPLLMLAEGTRAVAEGDLSPRPIVATKDELGTLTQSFNTMTGQLLDARNAVEQNRVALQDAKAHLESVLENMSAGVMVLDADFTLITCNEAVGRILQADVAAHVGQPMSAIAGMDGFASAVLRAFAAQSAQSAARSQAMRRAHWQQQIEIARRLGAPDEQPLTLLARGSRLPLENGGGYIVVFDDISDVISAQRSIAWGEVARRLAHEIKNPLTPIQLSAERLQMKLEHKLAGADAELLGKSTRTIVNQVAAMKRMVDDFRDYAKAPPAQLEPLDLNALVEEILHLYLAGDDADIIHARLAPKLPAVMGDATQLRQVIHNLLQNAQDALVEANLGTRRARVDVSTEAIHYRDADGADGIAVRLAIVDNGPGFSPGILARAFEPYVTSKARGTGLGLPMVKKIIDEHGARIELQNHPDGTGASVSILLLKLAPAPSAASGLKLV